MTYEDELSCKRALYITGKQVRQAACGGLPRAPKMSSGELRGRLVALEVAPAPEPTPRSSQSGSNDELLALDERLGKVKVPKERTVSRPCAGLASSGIRAHEGAWRTREWRPRCAWQIRRSNSLFQKGPAPGGWPYPLCSVEGARVTLEPCQ